MTDEIKKRSYIWNMISAMINAGQSALILIFISYRYSIAEAGIFSIGYAISLLGMTLSKYGQRNYQVTDVNEEFSFEEYLRSRWISMGITVIILMGYLALQFLKGTYNLEKLLIVFLMCIWKQIDAIEDVYYGMYQQRGRLDIGAKRYSERLIISTTIFCIMSLLRVPFLILMVVVFFLSLFVAAFLIRMDYLTIIQGKISSSVGKTGVLLKECFTLCISSTLAVYIGNLPKYFIDIYLEDTTQAQFGYLMMPAFVIMVLSMVIFQPIIREIGVAVQEGNAGNLSSYVRKQLICIALIAGMMLVAGGILGIPMLNILYHAELSAYWKELMLLLVGGGFYAISQFMIVPIVSMRKQKDIAIIYVMSASISMAFGMYFVPIYGILGASVLYLIINVLLSVLLLIDYRFRLAQIQVK